MSAASFYIGEVRHRRFGRPAHRLRYRIAYVLVDLDRMGEADAQSQLLSVDRGGVMSVRARDHGPGDADDLAGWVRGLLRAHGVKEPAARIELLTLPRMFGFVFNPLSVYFIRGAHDAIHHVLYEVSNTFGERHVYLCPARETGGALAHEAAKRFYVSPFFDVDGRYRFRVTPPGDALAVAIRYLDAAGRPALTALLTGRRAPVSDATCLKILASLPLMTLGVVAGIHWEALKLWLKGARYRPRRKRVATADVTLGAAPAPIEAPSQPSHPARREAA
jgi:DUF1365 family protein